MRSSIQSLDQAMHLARKFARQRAHCPNGLPLRRFRLDQVGHRLSLHQVDLVVQVRAAAKIRPALQGARPTPGNAPAASASPRGPP
jgi:hypothetical protein